MIQTLGCGTFLLRINLYISSLATLKSFEKNDRDLMKTFMKTVWPQAPRNVFVCDLTFDYTKQGF